MISFNEVNNENIYYKIIQMSSKYRDGRSFPIDEVVTSDKKINLNATTPNEMGGFYVSDYEHIFRWLIRGDTLCKVKIPANSHIYKTESNNGIYIADKIILTNPIPVDDKIATKLYNNSILPENSYFSALVVCCIKGYNNTALKVLNEKVNNNNINEAIHEFESFCMRREEESNIKIFELDSVKIIHNKLKNLLY